MLWYVGQIGIVLEIVGALIIVFTAYKTKKEFSDINNPASFAESGDALEKLVSEPPRVSWRLCGLSSSRPLFVFCK